MKQTFAELQINDRHANGKTRQRKEARGDSDSRYFRYLVLLLALLIAGRIVAALPV